MANSIISGQEIDEQNPFAAVASGVGFDNPFEADLLPPDKRQEQYVAEVMQSDVERANSENPDWTIKDMVSVARSLIDGFWLNKGVELGSLSGAVLYKATEGPLPPVGPVTMLFNLFEGDSVLDIRDEMLVSEEAKSANFAERRPIASTVSNIAGNMLSPVSLMGGNLVNSAVQLQRGRQAIQQGAEVGRVIPGLSRSAASTDDMINLGAQLGRQQAGPAAALLSRVPTSAAYPALGPAAIGAGVLAAEGGVIGFEGENLEEKVENAAFTAGISASVPFLFAGVKKGYDAVTKPMAQDIGEGGNFINLMFTDHALAPVYRSVISKAYGGRGLTEQQARSMVARVPTPRAAADTAVQIKQDAKRSLDAATRLINKGQKETVEEAKLLLDDQILKVKNELADAVGSEQDRLLSRVSELESMKGDANLLKFEAVRQADELVNSANGAFRGQVLNNSVPSGTTADEIAALGSLDPQDANALLDDLWKSKGFSFANGKLFPVDAQDADTFIEKIAKDYPELTLVEGGSIIPRVRGYVAEALRQEAADGIIEGKALVNLRSSIGRAINGLSDDKVSTRRFSTEVQDYFNDLLNKGLNSTERAAFEADKTAWSVRSLVDDATAKASGRDARSGAFTPQDFLESIKSYSPRFAARGAGRFQKDAQELALLTKQNEKAIIDLANKNASDVATDVLKQKAALRAELGKTKTALGKKHAEEIADLRRSFANTKNDSAGQAARRIALEEMKSKHRLQLLDLDNKVETVANETKALAELMPGNFRGSVFENLFNTALIGQTIQAAGTGFTGVSTSIGSTLVTGVAGASILSKEITQKILARQTGGQAAIRSTVGDISEGLQRVASAGSQQGAAGTAIAAGTAEALSPTEPLFTKERRDLLMKLPISGRAALYRNLEGRGQLKRLQAEDPELFKLLKAAKDR